MSIGVFGFLNPASKPTAIPQSFVFGATKLSLSGKSCLILVHSSMFKPQPPVIIIGKSLYFFRYGFATSKKHSSNAC